MLESSTCVPICWRSSVETAPLIAAAVPTFMNTGVSILPCTVSMWARFALPSIFRILYITLFILSHDPCRLFFMQGILFLVYRQNPFLTMPEFSFFCLFPSWFLHFSQGLYTFFVRPYFLSYNVLRLFLIIKGV